MFKLKVVILKVTEQLIELSLFGVLSLYFLLLIHYMFMKCLQQAPDVYFSGCIMFAFTCDLFLVWFLFELPNMISFFSLRPRAVTIFVCLLARMKSPTCQMLMKNQ
eukprot:TRINITY_DN2852_c1_g1_i6.p1 TRINITY_DN2852_c1_g1~~TRINITY_DN2852_c1_g1_i6.p1  ORF type:complete len:106 (-),score=1.22 TRINITY_DN2852_c1_g1_i6:142-459(-)